jgi:hypothetical protein
MLTRGQVTALTAQAKQAATYEYVDGAGNLLADWYFNDDGLPVYLGPEVDTRGVGLYGQTPENLVLVELLKPAALQLIVEPSMTITVLNTSAAWTGLYNINNLVDYLNSPAIQNLAQIALYEGAYQGLIDAGILTGAETARYQATFIQPAARYGVEAVADWVRGTAPTDLATQIQISARQAQYAIDFVDTYGPELNVAPELGGFDNTVFREELDQTVTDIIGNPRIPPIEYADIANVVVPVTISTVNKDDGTLRFAPGAPRG